jgi:hypothetical protein
MKFENLSKWQQWDAAVREILGEKEKKRDTEKYISIFLNM